MTDLRPEGGSAGAIGWRITATHESGYRANREGSDAWATVLAVVMTELSRLAYVVRFDDGETDLWVVDDPSDPYVWCPPPDPEVPRRFVVLTIDSERRPPRHRSRHLVIDLARAEGGAALVAECDERFGAEVVAAAMELHPDPPPSSDEPF